MRKNQNLYLLFGFLFLVHCLSAREFSGQEAQQRIPGAEKIITGTKSNIPEFILFRAETNLDFGRFSLWAHAVFSLSPKYDFKMLNSEKDQLGMVHYRYQQTYSGFPVQGTMYIVHTKNNKIVSVNGTLFDRLNPAAAPVMNEPAALSKAIGYMNAELYRWQIPQMEEHLKEVTGDPAATWFPTGELMLAPVNGKFSSENYRLAYRFDIYSERPLKREYVFVDAVTREIIYTRNRIHTANSQATAVTRYSGTRTITTDSVDAVTFRLRETGRGLGIETYNIHSTTNHAGATDFTDSNNVWNNINAQLDEVATDAHWGAEMTYDFYQTKFGRNSVNNAGQKLLSYVHYRTNYVNAGWDGTHMNYGDGNASFGIGPLTCLDITGHEITHGVTQYTSDLNYADESGALNEGFSDCMGNSIRQFGKNNASINWLIGDEIGGTPIRSMSNPNQYGNPDTYQGNNWDFATQEVHNNSGVMNFWYYLLTEGGSGTNDIGQGYSVTGLGINIAAAICYRMNTIYLFPTANYADARSYSIQAAIDLYGACTNEVIQTVNAWYAVGIGNAYSPGVTSDFSTPITLYCKPPAVVSFLNQSANGGAYTWNFGDGTLFSQALNPVHTYTGYGHYTVTLIADGGSCGIDTLLRALYISVDSLNPCLVSLPSSGTGDIQTACTGQLFDNGGSADNYTDNTDVSMTIAPPGASFVTLAFSSFNFESGFDYLYVYDGPTTASTLIGQYSGNALSGDTITSTTGSITIRQTSDQALNLSGFALIWQCTMPTVAPSAAFDADNTSSCSGTVQFTDLTTDGPASWLWDFGDGNFSSLQNPSHTYLANGTYDVKLTVTNSFGTDSSFQSNYITVNRPQAPTGTADTVCSGTSASLSASGSGIITWYQSNTGGTTLDTGSIFLTPPVSGNIIYYAESDIYPASQYVGPPNNTYGGGGNYSNNQYRSMLFDVMAPVRIVSVKVYAQGALNRTITLIKGGITLRTLTVNIPDGESRVMLNWDIPAGLNYELGCPGPANLFRNNSNTSYPYVLGGVITITGNNVSSSGNYYFFYDWELKGPPCVSVRTPIPVNVLPSPVASFTSSVFADSVAFTEQSSGAISWFWNFDDPGSGADDTSNLQNPSHLFSINGAHLVCLYVTNVAGCLDSSCQAFVIAGLENGMMKMNSIFSVFPNPVSDVLSIQYKGMASGKSCSVKLLDVLGKTVAEKQIVPLHSAGQYDLDFSSLAPGLYLLEMESEHQKVMKRIIRQ